MTTNETHGKFEDVLAVAKPELRPVCELLRSLITSLHTSFVEVVWPAHKIASFGVGPKKMTEHYAYIAVQGTQKSLRHVKLHEVSATKSAAVTALLRQAIADRERYAGEA